MEDLPRLLREPRPERLLLLASMSSREDCAPMRFGRDPRLELPPSVPPPSVPPPSTSSKSRSPLSDDLLRPDCDCAAATCLLEYLDLTEEPVRCDAAEDDPAPPDLPPLPVLLGLLPASDAAFLCRRIDDVLCPSAATAARRFALSTISARRSASASEDDTDMARAAVLFILLVI